ncbi:DUF342 domain-containing protein [Propionispora hippei]|uniref:Flagellar Assembly Protein A N-terminal region domain-containing protein n=1 Tax=Propionispora hippei DSM 15287 TaxID=1123003 RepID=A0A1M6D5Q6_9FIRM|nr:FapA family protein [Propionispora hippei]SHI68444.1 hypothetical protein SAMN02745170_00847 [Propionispora hippei DSM 15287]
MSENINVLENSTDGYFQVLLQEDGCYLTVFPPRDGGMPVDEALIFEDLNKREINHCDKVLVQQVIREAAGKSILIAPAEAEPVIRVLVSRDKMEAALQIEVQGSARPALQDKVMEQIAKSGVTFGIDADAIHTAINQPGQEIIFARGQQPIHGNNAYIKYFVSTENQGRPLEMADGRVDFKNLNLFTVVQPGDLLAQKYPATQGEQGFNVLGQVLPAKPGKDLLLPMGKNVEVGEPNQLVASIAGQVQIVNKKVSVIPLIEIKGDVDFSTGNIEFVGSVNIRGSVQPGFFVKAEGNVDVAGTVSGGIVEGKNVIIKRGIQGMSRGYIHARENLITQFIENATVSAGNEVQVSEAILHSRVSAGKKVVVEGRRGLITGGTISAGEEIRAQNVGNLMAVPTELEVGVNPTLREEYQKLRTEIRKVEVSLDQTQKALTILKAMNQNTMAQDKREMMLKLTKAQFHLVGQLGNMRKRWEEIEAALEEMKAGRIKVANTLYPGVKVIIGTLIKPIRETVQFACLFAEDGEIRVGTFK